MDFVDLRVVWAGLGEMRECDGGKKTRNDHKGRADGGRYQYNMDGITARAGKASRGVRATPLGTGPRSASAQPVSQAVPSLPTV